jgi:PadR family transcriptional regulator PadR
MEGFRSGFAGELLEAKTPGLDNRGAPRLYVDVLGIDMSEAQAELLKGTLDLLVLKVVALGPSHGYAIAQRLQQISKDFFQVHQGSLYPALHRLEERGWLQAEWKESETGREAKFYSLTKKGRRKMEEEARNWERLCEAVALVLKAQEKES